MDFLRFAAGENAPADSSYPPPPGGWAYAYEANAGEDSPGVDPGVGALDGTWNHDNGSDAWDGSPVGGELGPANQPGGAGIVEGPDATYLRIQDPGDPRDYGLPDPSNRKIYFGRDLAGEEFGADFIDDGVTLYFRARVPMDDPIVTVHRGFSRILDFWQPPRRAAESAGAGFPEDSSKVSTGLGR
ncbi:MAG: hypothetical protein ACUVYA_21580 [Planctomycetota bacterium]